MVGWRHQLDGHELSKLRELVMDREAGGAAVHGVTKSRTELIHWSDYFLCKQMRKVSIAKSKNLRPLCFDNHILVKASKTHCRIWAVTWLCSETIWMCHLQGICFWGSWRFVFLQSSYSKRDEARGCYVFSILPRPDLLVWKNTHSGDPVLGFWIFVHISLILFAYPECGHLHQMRWSCCWNLCPCHLLLWGQPQVSASTLGSRFCSAEQRDEEVSAGTMHVEQSSDPSDLGVVLENASSPPRKINNPQPPPSPILSLKANVFFKLIYLFLVVLGACCCVGLSLVAVSRGHSLVVRRLLTLVTSCVVEHRL